MDSSFLLWHDLWLINKPLIEHFGTNIISVARSTRLARVSSAISNGVWAPSRPNYTLITELRGLLNQCNISSHDDTNWDRCKPVKLFVIWNSIRKTAIPPPGLKLYLIS